MNFGEVLRIMTRPAPNGHILTRGKAPRHSERIWERRIEIGQEPGADPLRGGIMRSRILLTLAVAAAMVMAVTAAPSSAVATPGIASHGSAASGIPPAIPGTSSNFQLVGQNP